MDGWRQARVTAAPVDHGMWSVPDETACLVPGFDLREVLGKKGTRSMDRVSGLAVTAVGQLLAEVPGGRAEDTAIVLATTTGSAETGLTFTKASLRADNPLHVDAGQVPGGAMNCAAGLCAIWHQLKGPNTTLAGGRTAGLSALAYATRLLRSGRATRVICMAAEEFSSARAWMEHHSRDADDSALLGEGAAVLLVEAAGPGTGDRGLADVLAVRSRVCVDGDVSSAVDACVAGALAASGVSPDEVTSVVASGSRGGLGVAERAALAGVFGPDRMAGTTGVDLFGDMSAAAATFQLLGALAEDGPDGQIVLVNSVDRAGTVGTAVLRRVRT